MATKKDYTLVSIIGFLFAALLIPILANLKLPFWSFTALNIIALAVGFIVFANFALWIASLLGKIKPFFWQFAKFGATGALNTLLDLGVLNFLVYVTAIDASVDDLFFRIFKAISFMVGATNAYFWNKYWVFHSDGNATAMEYGKFFAVSLIGLFLNVAAASVVVKIIPGAVGLQLSGLVATAVALLWNFFGYKFMVFRRRA